MQKIIFFLFITLGLSSCISFSDLEIGEVKSVGVNKVSKSNIEINADIQVKNPNNYKVKIKKIEADVLLNNKKITTLNLNKKVVLRKNSDDVQTFLIQTELSNILSAAPSLLLGGGITLKIQGYIKGKVFFISKKVPVDVERKISADDLDLF